MQAIFKTGTFLTSENLNLAQQASGLSGIISGCTVYTDTEYVLTISKGVAKFDDGVIIRFDGVETINIANTPNGVYYVCAVEYSNYSVAYELLSSFPSYNHIVLARVTKNNNIIDIVNYAKTVSRSERYYLSTDYLFPYVDYKEDGSVGLKIHFDEQGVRYIMLSALQSESGGSTFAQRIFNVAFIANSDVTKITFRGNFKNENDEVVYLTNLAFTLFVNGNPTGISYTANYVNSNETSGYEMEIPAGIISKNDKCMLQLNLFNKSDITAYSRLYELILN